MVLRLSTQLEDALKKHEANEILEIRLGYKLYAKLMNDLEFAHEIINSALHQEHRKFKGIPLKVTHSEYDYQLITIEEALNIELAY